MAVECLHWHGSNPLLVMTPSVGSAVGSFFCPFA
jgi:hypothetical protein